MKKILLVEDDEDSFDMLARSLKREDYKAVGARDGEEALEVAKEEHPDLILMDIRLPEIDGLEATRRIRDSANGSDVPIIALTAYAMENDQEEAREAGCDDYHVKPVAFPQLKRQIETLL
ncbi:MAG: two-component system response regulator [Bacteroidetes bacterium QS_8_64_10]|jgi:CheY-like chemotaxis protein|nr:MAG: two-component system response regulator [Bacteroidetes bacterium QS_8_64_10]